MKVLIWGSRNLTWKHLPVMRALALHATLSLVRDEYGGGGVPPMSMDLMRFMMGGGDDEWVRHGDPMLLLNGDGPPGKERGAVGADKLALLACMETWPEKGRRVKWFPPVEQQKPNGQMETWGEAAARRDVEMADARPDRSYCVHSDLDRSKGSIITARALKERGIRYDYVRVSQSGDLLGVERR